MQRDLPGSLQMTATYLGIKGTRGPAGIPAQYFSLGAVNPCPGCPAGFVYLTSNGNSTREAGSFSYAEDCTMDLRRRCSTRSRNRSTTILLGRPGGVSTPMPHRRPTRRRLRQQPAGGSSSSGGAVPGARLGRQRPAVDHQTRTRPAPQSSLRTGSICSAERSLSTFDQRHLLNLQLQYTTGMGIGGERCSAAGEERCSKNGPCYAGYGRQRSAGDSYLSRAGRARA